MSIKRTLVGAAAVASASALMFTGVAQAAPAVNKVPTGPYQVCGNASTGPWVENGPPAGEAVAGVEVTGKLFTSAGVEKLSQVVSTGSDGGYCIEGDDTLVPTVLGGGWVTLEVTAVPAPYTTASPNPWKGGPIIKSTQIKTSTFLQHKLSGVESAYQFHFVIS